MFSTVRIKNCGINLIKNGFKHVIFAVKYSKNSANITFQYENKNPR